MLSVQYHPHPKRAVNYLPRVSDKKKENLPRFYCNRLEFGKHLLSSCDTPYFEPERYFPIQPRIGLSEQLRDVHNSAQCLRVPD
jgi:hypothetical protein